MNIQTKQHATYFSQGIVKTRQYEIYKIYLERFNNLENGETIDIKEYEDYYFFKFLHIDFKMKYVIKDDSEEGLYHIKYRQ